MVSFSVLSLPLNGRNLMTPTPLSHLTYAKFSNSVLEFLNGMYFRYMTMLDFVGFLASLATIGMFASST